jgi:hypothetical protein
VYFTVCYLNCTHYDRLGMVCNECQFNLIVHNVICCPFPLQIPFLSQSVPLENQPIQKR